MTFKEVVNRLMGRSVVDLAQEVDDALARLAEARGVEAACAEALNLAQADVVLAQQKVRDARRALFDQHPDLREDEDTVSVYSDSSDKPIRTIGIPGAFEEVDVDDPDILPNGDSVSSLGLGIAGGSDFDDDLGPDPWRETEGNE